MCPVHTLAPRAHPPVGVQTRRPWDGREGAREKPLWAPAWSESGSEMEDDGLPRVCASAQTKFN